MNRRILVAGILIFGLNDTLQAQETSCCGTLPSRFQVKAPDGMVWIPSGEFTMGGVGPFVKLDERPLHRVQLAGFWISRTPVTNDEFARFVKAKGYVTTAERAPTLEEVMAQLPAGSPPPPQEVLIAASLVFKPTDHPVPLNNPYIWWEWKAGADWAHPEGPDSSIKGKGDHPVVHVSWFDSQAYCEWVGGRLPTEAEWEYAARGGLDRQSNVWGDDPLSDNSDRINTWQGAFPYNNTQGDGYVGSSPVRKFEPNGYGLYDMSGNVWEWVGDWYHPRTYLQDASNKVTVNPQGASRSYDPMEPSVPKRTIRGGSFLCSDSYCSGYRPSARMKTSPDAGLIHTGFRVVKPTK